MRYERHPETVQALRTVLRTSRPGIQYERAHEAEGQMFASEIVPTSRPCAPKVLLLIRGRRYQLRLEGRGEGE